MRGSGFNDHMARHSFSKETISRPQPSRETLYVPGGPRFSMRIAHTFLLADRQAAKGPHGLSSGGRRWQSRGASPVPAGVNLDSIQEALRLQDRERRPGKSCTKSADPAAPASWTAAPSVDGLKDEYSHSKALAGQIRL
jgi:hypothetical protein